MGGAISGSADDSHRREGRGACHLGARCPLPEGWSGTARCKPKGGRLVDCYGPLFRIGGNHRYLYTASLYEERHERTATAHKVLEDDSSILGLVWTHAHDIFNVGNRHDACSLITVITTPALRPHINLDTKIISLEQESRIAWHDCTVWSYQTRTYKGN